MAIIIFIRNAELGKVKTRLAASVGDAMALRIYEKLLQVARTTTEAVEAKRYVYYSEYINPEDNWGAGHFKKRVQSGQDLGARMLAAFRDCLVTDAHPKAIIIGSDCPNLTPALLEESLLALENHDIVIGPAHDGGYYLLGMKQVHSALFEHMSWSTDQVLADTLERASAAQLSVHTLPTLHDVDTLEDLKTVGWW